MPKEFSSDEIHSMTQDFGSMIGRGGSAQVFRGNLDDGTPVAVKRVNIDRGRTVAGEEDFRRELSIIANVHHRSLVRLLGYCLQREGGLYLVYPFFENGSLDRWIFHGSDEQRRQLTWPKRLCIAVDVARALAYLHNECHWRILHLDVKPGNILLDGNLCAHVSDFGISLSITRGLTSVVDTEHLKGTFGYMAPEMLYNAVSHKSDVFSYGMTLLELVGGRRNMYPSLETPDFTRDYFPYIVREKVARGEVLGAVDAAIEPVDDEEAVKAVLKVALCCIQNQREMRPSMQTVVDMLEGRVAVELPLESRHHLL
ncbi:probable receptor-like protein kinase At5g20050 [Miscanthus floridulus]|uniref:probable receptor-like protein kinase At5g20050 n=1 Tax=Miscanthus floridulus TaxID=154761 RepID=UPI00345841D5